MLPIYISYFSGGQEKATGKTLLNALGFVLGFTVVFVLMGAVFGAAGGLLVRFRTVINIVTGLIVILFGLSFMEVLPMPAFRGGGKQVDTTNLHFARSVLLGAVFSVSWTPCVGAFLGSALMLASMQGHAQEGILMLLLYSLGLGIPFVISALLIHYLKGAFDVIKRHYTAVTRCSGAFLIVIGILMATGLMGRWLTVLG